MVENTIEFLEQRIVALEEFCKLLELENEALINQLNERNEDR